MLYIEYNDVKQILQEKYLLPNLNQKIHIYYNGTSKEDLLYLPAQSIRN